MKRTNMQRIFVDGSALRRSVIVLLVIFGALGSQGVMAVTWLHYKMDATGSWWGGDQINGYDSYSYAFAEDTAAPAHFYGSAGLPVRVNMAIEDNVVDNPLGSNDLLFQKFGFFYNPNTGQGNEIDTSTHYFRYSRTVEMVFSTGGCTLFKLDYMPQSGAFATVVVEKGTYLNGVFTPTNQVMDFIADSSANIGPGTYRIRTAFDSGTFSSNAAVERFANSNLTMLFLNEIENRPPAAVEDFYGVNQLSTLNEAAPGILVNDSDPDSGDTLSVVQVDRPAHASSFQLNPDGSFTYAPAVYFYGTDTFTYRAFDGTAYSDVTTVHITVRQPGSQGFITGGGKFFQDGRKCTFGFVAKVLGNGVQGSLEFQDHDMGLDVKSDSVEWVYAPNQIDGYFRGACSLNGVSGYSYFVEVHDRGEPGANDDLSISIYDSAGILTYSSGAVLSGGNIKIHRQ
ncbi:MAG: post-COAP-1 domain-containing protein [Fimbriimonadales bacterium]